MTSFMRQTEPFIPRYAISMPSIPRYHRAAIYTALKHRGLVLLADKMIHIANRSTDMLHNARVNVKSVGQRAALYLPSLSRPTCIALQGKAAADGREEGRKLTVVDKLSLEDRQLVVRRALNTDQQDAQDYLERVRARFDR